MLQILRKTELFTKRKSRMATAYDAAETSPMHNVTVTSMKNQTEVKQ